MSDPNHWYDLKHLPDGAVHVRVRFGAYVLSAASSVDKKGVRHWHEVRGRELVPLRQEPEAWQPLAKGWTWPAGVAPEPVPVLVRPRTATVALAFDAVAAVAEMEADREAARASREAPPAEDGGQWWRDVSRVRYEAMGAVSREHGEARIMRALILERSIRLDLQRPRTNAAALAALKLTLADVLAEQPSADWVPPLVSQPEDYRDFDVVMGWFVEVMPSRRELLILRGRMLAPPATWVQIGDEIGRSSERARQIYGETLDRLIEAGNRPARRAPARLANLQERNRAARRRA